MKLAKPCIDVAMFTSALDRVEPFWRDEVGLDFDHVLPLKYAGVRWNQHRYRVGQSIIKLNDRPVIEAAASGYRELLIAREGVTAPRAMTDPDGNRVTLVPPGYRGMTGVGVRMSVRSLPAFRAFFRNIGLVEEGRDAFRAGDSLLLLDEGDAVACDPILFASGWRYITFQIYDVRAEHARFVDVGARAGVPIVQVRDVVRASMVRDPDGNWIELSQRASIVGPLD